MLCLFVKNTEAAKESYYHDNTYVIRATKPTLTNKGNFIVLKKIQVMNALVTIVEFNKRKVEFVNH